MGQALESKQKIKNILILNNWIIKIGYYDISLACLMTYATELLYIEENETAPDKHDVN